LLKLAINYEARVHVWQHVREQPTLALHINTL